MILLSGENMEIALAELDGVLSSLGSIFKPVRIDGRTVIFDSDIPSGVANRMGYSHFSGSVHGECGRSIEEIATIIDDFLEPISRERSLSIKTVSPAGKNHLSSSSLFQTFTSIVGEKEFMLDHRSADLKLFLIAGEMVYIGIIEEITDRNSIRSRKGSRMPFNRPVVMDPAMARCMINLTGLPPGSTIMDPFMGPAGLSIEGGLLGHKIIGVEMDREIFEGARSNIMAQNLDRKIEPHLGDSRDLEQYDWWSECEKIDGIVTDPPFGRSASLNGEDPADLIRIVIEKAGRKMTTGSPLVMDTSLHDVLDRIPGFKLKEVFPVRIHRSLTRYIGLLSKM